MATTALPDLVLYTRPGCELCDEARLLIGAVVVERLSTGRPAPSIVELDIATDPALERTYFDRIPVVEVGGRRIETIISAKKLRRMLSDAFDGRPAHA